MVMNMVAEALAHDRAIMPPCAGLSHQTVFEGAAECAICVLSRAPRSMQDKLIQAAEFRRDWARRNKKDDLYRQWRVWYSDRPSCFGLGRSLVDN